MTSTEELAAFVDDVSYETFTPETQDALKKRVLDTIGIAIGAIGADAVEIVRKTVREETDGGPCQIWGSSETTSPSQAAMMNTTLTRYMDFMDSFLAPKETPHPADNIASAVVCGEYADASGEELLEAVGIAYEVQHGLAYNAPVRDRGWDHVTHTVISQTVAASHLLGLDGMQTRNAIGIAGTAHNALRVARTGTITMWKGIAAANAARNAVYSTLLARNGMNGPVDLFNGEKGWKHIVAGDFTMTLDRACPAVHDTMTKRYVAETYAQSAVEGLLELLADQDIDLMMIETIHLDTFHGAYQIIGGGVGGDRYAVDEREQADHSLPYMLAVAALDGELLDRQYRPERIRQEDVQSLLRNVTVAEDDELTARFEHGEMPARLTVAVDGEEYTVEKTDFHGHPNTPMGWAEVEQKFHALTKKFYGEARRTEIVETVKSLEDHSVRELVALLD